MLGKEKDENCKGYWKQKFLSEFEPVPPEVSMSDLFGPPPPISNILVIHEPVIQVHPVCRCPDCCFVLKEDLALQIVAGASLRDDAQIIMVLN